MPVEFYIIVGLCVAVMGISAFYLRDDNKAVMAAARVGIVLGGSGLFVSVMYYTAIMVAVLIVILPFCLIAAWWNGVF